MTCTDCGRVDLRGNMDAYTVCELCWDAACASLDGGIKRANAARGSVQPEPDSSHTGQCVTGRRDGHVLAPHVDDAHCVNCGQMCLVGERCDAAEIRRESSR